MNISEELIIGHREAQDIAKKTCNHLCNVIKAGVTEEEIVIVAKKTLNSLGSKGSWYYGIEALTFVGKRTIIAISGRDYKPTDTKVKDEDIVTIDFGTIKNGFWGDFARTFIVSQGKAIGTDLKDFLGVKSVFFEGMALQEELHKVLRETVCEEMIFCELFKKINNIIKQKGFTLKDHRGNIGHTLEEDSQFIDTDNRTKFKDVSFWTFEPFIAKGSYGFKREDVFFFYGGQLNVL